jgi:hypothetical protein
LRLLRRSRPARRTTAMLPKVPHDVGDPLVPPEQRDLVGEVRVQAVEVGVGPRPGGHGRPAIPEGPAIGGQPVPLGVAQHLAPVELVQRVGARPAGQVDRARPEQLLQLAHSPEHTDPLVLVDVIQVAHGDEPLGRHRLVVGRDRLRDPGLPQRGGRFRPDTDQLGEALVRRWRHRHVGVGGLLQQVIDLLDQNVSQLRVRHELGRQAVRDRLLQCRDPVEEGLVILLRRHRGSPQSGKLACESARDR